MDTRHAPTLDSRLNMFVLLCKFRGITLHGPLFDCAKSVLCVVTPL